MKLLAKLGICWPHRWSKWHAYEGKSYEMLRQQRHCGRCSKVDDRLVEYCANAFKWEDREIAPAEIVQRE